MISPTGHANNISAVSAPQEPRPERSGFGDFFSVSLADSLLKETKQYGKWKEIRENDFSRAIKIARLVLERHDYVAGKMPVTEQNRKHFDHLTELLRSDGINLYSSRQFKTPIFDEITAGKSSEISAGKTQPEAGGRVADLNISGLTRRFYKKDCYEFLAGILEENGISYYGVNGVGSALIDRARSMGMNPNAFLTGEGVTRLLCDNPVRISIPEAADTSFDETWKKIEPHLKKGAILSFSSQHAGHTGVIDRKDGRWVFINSSGTTGDRRTYRVIEEDLKHEIQGRLEKANRQQTFLDITIGSVNRLLASKFESPLSEGNESKGIDLFQIA